MQWVFPPQSHWGCAVTRALPVLLAEEDFPHGVLAGFVSSRPGHIVKKSILFLQTYCKNGSSYGSSVLGQPSLLKFNRCRVIYFSISYYSTATTNIKGLMSRSKQFLCLVFFFLSGLCVWSWLTGLMLEELEVAEKQAGAWGIPESLNAVCLCMALGLVRASELPSQQHCVGCTAGMASRSEAWGKHAKPLHAFSESLCSVVATWRWEISQGEAHKTLVNAPLFPVSVFLSFLLFYKPKDLKYTNPGMKP